jgi:flagellar hook-length control protein FliK
VKTSEERFSRFDSIHQQSNPDKASQLAAENATDFNMSDSHDSEMKAKSPSVVGIEQESDVRGEKEGIATDEKETELFEKNGEPDLEASDELSADADRIVSEEAPVESSAQPSTTISVHEIPTLSDEVAPQVAVQAAVTQKKSVIQEGLERPSHELVRESVTSTTDAPQQEASQKLFTQAEKGEVTLPTNFQEVTGEEAELLREFSSAVQKTVAHQQAQQAKPQETDQLARIVEGLLQGKVSESGLPQSSATAPALKEQSELFSSLIQSRVIGGGNEGALAKGLEQLSGLAKAGSQQGNNQTLHQQGHDQLSLAKQKSAESSSAMNKEAFKELSKGQELRTLKKVEEALKEVAKSRDGKTISLRLDPPSLGSVRVEVSIRDGVLHARLAADSAHVNNLLRDKGAELQQVLRGLGIDVNGVNVSVQDDGSQSQQDGNMFLQQENQFERGAGHETSSSTASAAAVSAAESKSSPLVDHWVA